MTRKRQREIVIEYERIQLIRKKAKTQFTHCDMCGGEADFVPIEAAAELFETGRDNLIKFIKENGCHYQENGSDKIYLCLASMLECMNHESKIRRLAAK